jgi:hypothetical protein
MSEAQLNLFDGDMPYVRQLRQLAAKVARRLMWHLARPGQNSQEALSATKRACTIRSAASPRTRQSPAPQ